MILIWHIFKKDLRRLWLPLMGWGAIIVLQFLVFQRNLLIESASNHSTVMILWSLHLVVGWLLVPQLIQDDPLLGDAAAWRVRPISGARLLAAKLFGFVTLLCLWPSLLTLPWWLQIGLEGPGVARAVAANTLGMAGMLSLAWLIAVLTTGFMRFVGWSLVLLAAVGFSGMVLAAGLPLQGTGLVAGSILISRGTLASAVLVTVAVGVIGLQYLGRRLALARGLTAGAFVTAALIVQFWPWSIAQMQAWTGLKRYSLPTLTVRPGSSILYMPADPARQKTAVRFGVEFSLAGRIPGDSPWLQETSPRWRFGENRWTELPIRAGNRPNDFKWVAQELANPAAKAPPLDTAWQPSFNMELPGSLAQHLRNGEGVISAHQSAAVWRGEKGPSVVLHAGRSASGGAGLSLIHVNRLADAEVTRDGGYGDSMGWFEIGPLFRPTRFLSLLNPDGAGGHALTGVLLVNGRQSAYVDWSSTYYSTRWNYLPQGGTPVGLLGLSLQTSSFNRERWLESDNGWLQDRTEIPLEGATLTLLPFHEAAPMNADMPETAFVPELVVEGRVDEALRRAQAEGKRVAVHITPSATDEQVRRNRRFQLSKAGRELLAAHYVVVETTWDNAPALRKPNDDQQIGMTVILTADGKEQDRLRDMAGKDWRDAMEANAAGKTYAAFLTEALAAAGGDDRKLRYQLHDALRARGELAGAFDAVLWIFDHSPAPFEGLELTQNAQRLERFVQTYAPARGILLERRDLAVANLRQDPRNEGAARMLFTITLGLQNDAAVWADFPRVMPHENPLWWEFMRTWISRCVSAKNPTLAVAGTDLEKFFAEGPAWVRAQLMRKRALIPGEPPATVDVWQRQLVRAGENCVEALLAAGRPDIAVRIARAIIRVDSSRRTADGLYWTLYNRGARAQAKQLQSSSLYAPE